MLTIARDTVRLSDLRSWLLPTPSFQVNDDDRGGALPATLLRYSLAAPPPHSTPCASGEAHVGAVPYYGSSAVPVSVPLPHACAEGAHTLRLELRPLALPLASLVHGQTRPGHIFGCGGELIN